MLNILVSDQGPGIPEGELGEIFKPFFRGQGAQGVTGHGLGLAIAMHVIEAREHTRIESGCGRAMRRNQPAPVMKFLKSGALNGPEK